MLFNPDASILNCETNSSLPNMYNSENHFVYDGNAICHYRSDVMENRLEIYLQSQNVACNPGEVV